MKKITITIDEIDPNDPHYIIKRTYQGEMISENKTLAISNPIRDQFDSGYANLPSAWNNKLNSEDEIINKNKSNYFPHFRKWLYDFMPTVKYILPETIPVGHEINATKHALSGSNHYRCYYILYVNKDLMKTIEYKYFDCRENVEKALFIQELAEIGWDGKTKLNATNVIRGNKS